MWTWSDPRRVTGAEHPLVVVLLLLQGFMEVLLRLLVVVECKPCNGGRHGKPEEKTGSLCPPCVRPCMQLQARGTHGASVT
jgi:hypothetical protein